MSWLFSQALVEEYLGENSLDGERCALLSGNPTQQVFLPPDNEGRIARRRNDRLQHAARRFGAGHSRAG